MTSQNYPARRKEPREPRPRPRAADHRARRSSTTVPSSPPRPRPSRRPATWRRTRRAPPSTRPTSAPRSRTGWRARGWSGHDRAAAAAGPGRARPARRGHLRPVRGVRHGHRRRAPRGPPRGRDVPRARGRAPRRLIRRAGSGSPRPAGVSPARDKNRPSAREGGNRRLPCGPGPGGPHRAGAHAAAPRPGLQLPRRVRRGDHRPCRDRPDQGAGDPACLAGRVDQPGPAGPHPGRRHRRRGPAPVPLPRGVAAGPRRASSTTGC